MASRFAAAWTFGYALYRSYYALGGTLGMLGTPTSVEQFRRINAIAAVLLVVVALLAMVLPRVWRGRGGRPLVLALCWIVAVGCVSHALIGVVQRIASLTGSLTIDYPFWLAIARRKADLQALLLNEPWFLIEGLAWATIAWARPLRESQRRRWWIGSALLATAAATAVGLLSAFGVIGRWIVG